MSKKRRREQSSVDTRLVEIYEDLANEDEDIRFTAAHAFLTKFAPTNHPSDEQLSEAVRRLVRGLCSGRKAARIGFSIALTELLSQKWGPDSDPAGALQISGLINVLIKQTEATGNIGGQVCSTVVCHWCSMLMLYLLGKSGSSIRPSVWR